MHLPRKPSYRLVSPVGSYAASNFGGGARKVSAIEWIQAATGYVHSCAVLGQNRTQSHMQLKCKGDQRNRDTHDADLR